MIPGTPEWLVRSLTDWVLEVRQGIALVTYRSRPAREQVLAGLETRFLGKQLQTEWLQCNELSATDFVAAVVSSKADVLFVIDPDYVFSTDDQTSAFWVNFSREPIVERPGVQIWWMSPSGANRLAQLLPDLNRFFLFREELESELIVEPSPELAQHLDRIVSGVPGFGKTLLARALKAASIKGADKQAVWLQLGFPAIDGFMNEGDLDSAIHALGELTQVAGQPLEAIEIAAGQQNPSEVAFAFRVLGGVLLAQGDFARAHSVDSRFATHISWSLFSPQLTSFGTAFPVRSCELSKVQLTRS